ncbi:MAG: TonB-dependent receptor [Opitutae bacterium]|nr:TonB-dependent receptor [Opitutae bacterium]
MFCVPRFLRSLAMAALLVGALHAAEPARAFDIPAGPAENALKAFSTQSGVELLFSTEAASGVRTNAVRGELPPSEAIERLLAGTELQAVRDAASGVLRITRVPKPVAPSEKNVASRPVEKAGAAREDGDQVLKLETFTVTGSNIRRVDGETALPVTKLTRDDLDARGATTMAELFETIGFAEPSAISELNNGPQLARGDVASVDLRGIGSGSTLALINGRRMAPHPISMAENGVPSLAANINSVPRALVTRVELLRDGASAIYGADAAAGVINTIITPAGQGRGARFSASVTQHGGANEVGATLYDSFRTGKTNLSVSVDVFHRDLLAARDRDWAKNADLRVNRDLPAPWNGQPIVDANGATVRDNDFANTNSVNQWGQWQRGFIQPDYLTFVGSRPTGNVGITTSTTPPAGVATMASSGMFYLIPGANGAVNFKQTAPSKNIDNAENATFSNWNNWKTLVPRTDRLQFATFVDRPLNERIRFFGDLLFYAAHSVTRREPTNFKNTDDQGIYLPASNPFNPFGTRFYSPTGAPNADGTPRLVGTPADVSLWTGISPGQNSGYGFRPRETEVFSYSYRALAGLRGTFGQTWEWESGLLASGAQTHEYEHFQVRESRLREALARTDPVTAFNPFPVTFKIANNQIVVDKVYENPASVLEPLYDDEDRFGRTNLFLWDAKVNGRLGRLFSGGEIGVASGVEVRYETYADKRSTYSGLNPPGSGAQFPFLRENDNDFLALSSNVPISAHQTVYAGYAEVALPFVTSANRKPLVDALELTLAGRFEHFSIFGQTTKPKASLLWNPARWLKFRASVAESFRAPNLVQTNVTALRRQISADDPYRFGVTALASDGTAQRTSYRQGNQNLVPEEAQTWTAGFVLDVPKVRGLSLTFDYFSINQNKVIENMGTQAVIDRDELLLDLAVQAALASGKSIDTVDLGSGTANYLGYSKVTRKPVSDADRAAFATYNAAQPTNATKRAPVGEIVSVVDDYINLSGRDIQGYEFGFEWRSPKSSLGQFTLEADSTHYILRRSQAEPGAAELDELGRNGRTKWRANASFGWRRGPWSARWFTSYFGSFVDTSAATTEAVYTALGRPDYISVFNDNGVTRYLYKVEPFINHNASLSYRFERGPRWLRDVTVRSSVNNVFDTIPPLADEQFGYMAGTANVRGRQFGIELSRKF